MKKEANNRAMMIVETLRRQKRLPKSALMARDKSRTKYYERMDAVDVKVNVLKGYLEMMGCELIVRDRATMFERRI